MGLIELIKSLLPEEQERLELHLTPVVKARKAYLDFTRIEMPKDNKALQNIETKRSKLLGSGTDKSNSELRKLNDNLQAIREKISTHVDSRVALNKQFIKAKETFVRHY